MSSPNLPKSPRARVSRCVLTLSYSAPCSHRNDEFKDDLLKGLEAALASREAAAAEPPLPFVASPLGNMFVPPSPPRVDPPAAVPARGGAAARVAVDGAEANPTAIPVVPAVPVRGVPANRSGRRLPKAVPFAAPRGAGARAREIGSEIDDDDVEVEHPSKRLAMGGVAEVRVKYANAVKKLAAKEKGASPPPTHILLPLFT